MEENIPKIQYGISRYGGKIQIVTYGKSSLKKVTIKECLGKVGGTEEDQKVNGFNFGKCSQPQHAIMEMPKKNG